ncbi:MAG: hypothetical protein EKK64_03415 [Neisseriaceae bacterium]|nr:MAG: hypothetical protein EKK64_03415 [Neisseriaceae bacterium]
MVFDGEEFLEFATKSIRKSIDFISVTFQTISYFGNKTDSPTEDLLKKLKKENLIDEYIHFQPDLTLSPKQNELNLRNIGLNLSRLAGCTHHISADVDEFYDSSQLEFAKEEMEKENYDFSMIPIDTYYKNPCFLVVPDQKLSVTFIHPVRNEYSIEKEFPFSIEITRRFKFKEKYRVFSRDEIIMHHMSYVRKDIWKKFANSDNGKFYNLKKFASIYNKYEVGERLYLIPDYLNRRTKLVENKFNIEIK